MTTLFSWALETSTEESRKPDHTAVTSWPEIRTHLRKREKKKRRKEKKESKTIQLYLACGRTEVDITSCRIQTHRLLTPSLPWCNLKMAKAMRNLKPFSLFLFFFASVCERIFIKTHSIESRWVKGPELKYTV